MFSAASADVGRAYALSGRAAEAIPLLERAIDTAQRICFAFAHSHGLIYLGEARLALHDHDAAARCASEALDLTRRHHQRGTEAWALRLEGEIAAARGAGDVATAQASYRQALAIAAELGMRPLAAHCHLGLGRIGHRAGNRHEAEGHLRMAATMYRDMEMRAWVDRADAELGSTR